jgi:DNA polymerase-3 subunit gamma/tau
MLRLILVGDTMGALHKLDEVIMTGRDLSQFISDFVWYLRNLLLVMTAEGQDISEMLEMSADRLAALEEETEMTDEATVMRYIRILSELSNQLKYSTSKRVLVEIAIVKLAKPQMEQNMDSILNRIANIEKTIDGGVFVNADTVRGIQGVGQNPDSTGDSQAASANPPVKLQTAVPEEVQQAVNSWGRIQGRVSMPAGLFLKDVRLTVTPDGRLLIVTRNKNGYMLMSRESTIEEIERIIGDEIDREVKVEIRLLEEDEKFEDTFVEITKNINMEIEEEDF